MTVTVITNHHEREVLGGHQLTEAERQEFDYIDWDAVEREEQYPEFVRYKGQLYDLGDVETAPGPLGDWDQYRPDSFFSGVLFRWPREEDGNLCPDYVICGRYYS